MALINDSMARRYWRRTDPIGRAFYWADRRFQVIGVVEDVLASAIDQPVGPAVYFDAFQMENHVLSSGVFIVRTSEKPDLANIAGGFALLACVLALAGIYGVFSQAVTKRVREIGLRLALGAQPAEIRNRILWQGLRLIVCSASVGAVLCLLSLRLLSSLLFGVGAADPLVYLASAITLFAVALLGLYAPARRASRVDPLVALRSE